MKNLLLKNRMIILCGGRGKRMGSITEKIPKPMVKVGKKPIISHKLKYYQSQGVKKFIFCLGYKAKVLKKYLLKDFKYNIFYDGGLRPGILKRIYLIKKHIKEDAIISYGDTLAKINFKKLLLKHKKSNCCLTLVVAPIQNPFGIINWDSKGRAKNFKEKPILNHFIGYAVISPNFFNKISNKIINLKDGQGIVKAIQVLIKKKEVNIYKFDDLQVTINSPIELKNAELNYNKYFTIHETPKK